MKLTDRYASAIYSSRLVTSRENDKDGQTVVEDLDALGAMAWADRDLTRGHDSSGDPVKPAPLAVPLERLFSGDHRAAHEIVQMMAEMVFSQSWKMKVKITQLQSLDMAMACLAWCRSGTCKACGGHGQTLTPGSKSFSGHDCQPCTGTGKIPFNSAFRQEHQELAIWLVAEVEREMGRAGAAAMKVLAPKLEL